VREGGGMRERKREWRRWRDERIKGGKEEKG
jgi:hypothetical protein